MRDIIIDMRSNVGRTGPQIDGLKDTISSETRARELAQESLMKTLRDHRDALSIDIRKAHMAIEPHKVELQRLGDALEQERTVRDMAIAPLHERIGGVERTLEEPQKLEAKLELPALRAITDNHKARHDEHAAGLEQVNQGLTTAVARLDKQLTELTAKTEAESAARRALKSELEETMAATTTQVKNLATEQTEVTKSQRETMERFVNEHATRVATSHTSHQEKLQKSVTALKDDLTARLQKMEQGHKELAQREFSAPSTPVSRNLESPDKKYSD